MIIILMKITKTTVMKIIKTVMKIMVTILVMKIITVEKKIS